MYRMQRAVMYRTYHRTYGIVQKSNGKLELDDHDDIIPCAPDD